MRQYILPEMPDNDGVVTVSGKDFKYLYAVLRLREGMCIDARTISGDLISMHITGVNTAKKTMILQHITADCCGSSSRGQRALETEPPYKTVLLQWLPKLSKMDDIIRQAVEVGTAVIIPVISMFSPKEAQTAQSRMDRWQRIVKEARQQSGSPVATQIFEPQIPEKAIETCLSLTHNQRFCGIYLSEDNGIQTALHEVFAHEYDIAALAVGAEGGYAPDEIHALAAAGFVPVHFVTNILRSETAAIYGLAALQTVRTEMNIWKK